jgi:hypothetical protein
MIGSNLKIIFSEIIKGYSKKNINGTGTLFFKHINNQDSAEIDIYNQQFLEKAKSMGLPTHQEQEEYLIKEGLWEESKNKKISELKKFILNLKSTKSKLFLKSQLDQIGAEIDKNETELKALEMDKKALIGFTAEEYTAKKINEYYMYMSLYKSEDLKDKFFSEVDYEELDNKDIVNLIKNYNEVNDKFNDLNLKKISLAGYFSNIFYLSQDDPYIFYGKPLVELSFYQIELFSYGRYFKNIIQNAKTRPPDYLTQDPDKLIEWFEGSKNVEEVLNKNSKISQKDNIATSIVGATTEDLKRLGIKEEKDTSNTIDLAKEASKKGGKLDMQDLIKLHGL